MKQNTLSGKKPKRKLFAEITASLLFILFVHTAISNYVNIQSLKNLLAFYTRDTTTFAWAIVIIEALISLLLFMPKTRIIGFSAVLLASIVGGRIVLKYPDFPHHFGGLLNHFTNTQHILFYCLLSLMAIIGGGLLILKRKKQNDSVTHDSAIFT